MGLHHSYTLLSPFYDLVIAKASLRFRKVSLNKITFNLHENILVSGIGSGLDIPLLPTGPNYYGVDLTLSMLRHAKRRAQQRIKYHGQDIHLQQGNVMRLPYQDCCFDTIVMHLILTIAPDPVKTLREAQRVLKPGGTILILDKFLKPGQLAPVRKFLNPVIKRIATQLDVVLENVLPQCKELHLVENTNADKSGWFRHIILKKRMTFSHCSYILRAT